jgi:hypothetical protein
VGPEFLFFFLAGSLGMDQAGRKAYEVYLISDTELNKRTALGIYNSTHLLRAAFSFSLMHVN